MQNHINFRCPGSQFCINNQWHYVGEQCIKILTGLHSEQAHENIQKFEHQAGLTDAGYSPHKGLSAEDTRFHRLGDGTLPVSINKCQVEALICQGAVKGFLPH